MAAELAHKLQRSMLRAGAPTWSILQEVGKGPESTAAQGQGKEKEKGSCDLELGDQRNSIGCQGCKVLGALGH